MARHLSGREHAGLQHGVLAGPSPGGKTGGAGRRTRVCRSVGNLGAVSYLAVALRFLRTPLPAARPADGGIRFSAEFPVLAGAGPVPPALLRHGGTNHVQRKRFHSSSAFFIFLASGRMPLPWIPLLFAATAFYSPLAALGGLPLAACQWYRQWRGVPPLRDILLHPSFRPPFCWECASFFIMGR